MLLLMWYDDRKHIPLAQRLHDGAAAYLARFGTMPNVVQVSADEPGDTGTAERLPTIRKNNYWFGYALPTHTEPVDYAGLPHHAGGVSHPTHIAYQGGRWAYVAGSALAGVVEYRPC